MTKTICGIGMAFLSIPFFCGLLHAETKPVRLASPFPHLTFTQTLSKGEQTYLGIPQKKRFSFKDIRGNLILVEFTSVYCLSCQRQTVIYNELYASIEGNPKLKGKVKVIGLAAGNNIYEVEIFKKEYKVLYPIFADPKFAAHIAVGSPRAPFTIWVRRDVQGKSLVVSTHLGLIDTLETVLNETGAVLQYDLALLKRKKGAVYEGDSLMPPLTEEELMAKAREGMEASGGRVLKIEKIALRDDDWIYAGKVDFGTYQENLFSILTSRRAICDICDDTFFIYTFNSKGNVTNLIPIQLPKFGNFQWTEREIQKLKSRTVGRSVLKPFNFDPSVDSVSGATITAALIFDSLDKAKEIYGKLKKEGYIRR